MPFAHQSARAFTRTSINSIHPEQRGVFGPFNSTVGFMLERKPLEQELRPRGSRGGGGYSVSGIFGQLFKYHPRDARSPREDFFTEAFVAVLRTNHRLRVDLTRWLINQDVDSVHLETQSTLAGGDRVDVWIDAQDERSGARHFVAMENKIQSSEGLGQLNRYCEALRNRSGAVTRTLVYATCHERTAFQPSSGEPEVRFRPLHWIDVADWMTEWAAAQPEDRDSYSTPFIHELHLLMQEWGMAMALSADDLAIATRYRTTVEANLIAILDETEAACELASTKQNQWSRNKQFLCYSSGWFGPRKRVYIEFAFDFDRNDTHWSTPRHCLPSAYFALKGTVSKAVDSRLSQLCDWERPPEDWGGDYLFVKRLGALQIGGSSLHGQYLRFFRTARDELWQALGL